MSNLNSLLKTQLNAAIHAIYDEMRDNRFTSAEQVSKALLDQLFPDEAQHNAEMVVKVPTAASDSEGSTDSKKARKKREPMSEEAKAAMTAKRAATIAAKAQAGSNAAAPAEVVVEAKPEVKERKVRGPMSEEAKAAMAAKRKATLEAKKAAV
jgi:hypothetical protein